MRVDTGLIINSYGHSRTRSPNTMGFRNGENQLGNHTKNKPWGRRHSTMHIYDLPSTNVQVCCEGDDTFIGYVTHVRLYNIHIRTCIYVQSNTMAKGVMHAYVCICMYVCEGLYLCDRTYDRTTPEAERSVFVIALRIGASRYWTSTQCENRHIFISLLLLSKLVNSVLIMRMKNTRRFTMAKLKISYSNGTR